MPSVQNGKEAFVMANSFEEVLSILPDYRNALFTAAHTENAQPQVMAAFAAAAGGGVPAFSTPLRNVHAVGAGVRVRKGNVVSGEFVIKAYVFNKLQLAQTPQLMRSFGGIDVDVEVLPVQLAAPALQPGDGPAAQASAKNPRSRVKPIVGGVSTAPQSAPFAGTLGAFVQRHEQGATVTFALSNNHVFADVNSMPIGKKIVRPAQGDGSPSDVYARLSAFTPIAFPPPSGVRNRFDAAIAMVTDLSLIQLGSINGIANYTPLIGAPKPGMRVTKSGRTTGVTTGTITAVHTNNVQVNYGTQSSPRVATFIDTIQIVGDNNQPFSLPGDSGSVILDQQTGHPVALLFAGDGYTTTACDFGGVCRALNVVPA
jgi:hypothetical protein